MAKHCGRKKKLAVVISILFLSPSLLLILFTGIQQWPDFDYDFEIQNMNFKLYGGSQYERLINEFEFVAHSREFPTPSMNEVASALGSAKSHNVPVFETAVLRFFFFSFVLNYS
jgi:hypothetical protein